MEELNLIDTTLNKINFLKYRIKYNFIPRVRNKLKNF